MSSPTQTIDQPGKEVAEEHRTPVKTEAAEPETEGDFINIKVTSQTSADVFFKVKRDVRLRRLMDMYCGKHSLDPKTVVFLDEQGRNIRPVETQEELGLRDGDSIDVHMAQQGGSARASPY